MAARAARERAIVYGHKSVQPLPEHAAREARGREIGLKADHGMCDLVARVAARGKLASKAQVARRPEKERNEITPGRSAVQLGKNVMMGHRPRHLWLPHVSLSAKSRRSDTRLVQRRDVWQVWDCSVAFHRAPLDEDIVVIPPKGLCPAGFVWQLRRAMNGTRKASLAFGSVVTKELVAMPAAPFAAVVVAPMCFFIAEGSMWP